MGRGGGIVRAGAVVLLVGCFPSLSSLSSSEGADARADARPDASRDVGPAGSDATLDAPRDGGHDALRDALDDVAPRPDARADASHADAGHVEAGHADAAVLPTLLGPIEGASTTPLTTDGTAVYFATASAVYAYDLASAALLTVTTSAPGAKVVVGDANGHVFYDSDTGIYRLPLGMNETAAMVVPSVASNPGLNPGLAVDGTYAYYVTTEQVRRAASAGGSPVGLTVDGGTSAYYPVLASGYLVFSVLRNDGYLAKLPLDGGTPAEIFTGFAQYWTGKPLATNGAGVLWMTGTSIDYTDEANLAWTTRTLLPVTGSLSQRALAVALDDRYGYALLGTPPDGGCSTGQIVERGVPIGDGGAARVLADDLPCAAGVAATGEKVYFTGASPAGGFALFSVPR